jgi:hypothetical protein
LISGNTEEEIADTNEEEIPDTNEEGFADADRGSPLLLSSLI